MGSSRTVPGSIYLNKNRYWWRPPACVDPRRRPQPLVPIGQKWATSNRDIAEAVARLRYAEAILKDRAPKAFDGRLATLCGLYVAHCKRYYSAASKEPAAAERAVKHLVDLCPNLSVTDFGPRQFKAVRQGLIDARRPDGKSHFCQSEIARRTAWWKRMYRWGVSEELVPLAALQILETVSGLYEGKDQVRPPKEVDSVAQENIDAILPYLPPVVADMLMVQLLSGLRPGELCKMKPRFIQKVDDHWFYVPVKEDGSARPDHKTARFGHRKAVPLGPLAMKILDRYINRPFDAHLFSPAEAMEQRLKVRESARQTPHGPGRNRRGSNRKGNPRWRPGDHYTTTSYGRAITYAIRACNRDRQGQVDNMKALGTTPAIALVPDWHPHQLRHTCGERIRNRYGKEAARAQLGQFQGRVTDGYTGLPIDQAIRAMQEIG